MHMRHPILNAVGWAICIALFGWFALTATGIVPTFLKQHIFLNKKFEEIRK